MERYCIHHQGASTEDIRASLMEGEEISSDLAAILAGRSWKTRKTTDRYVLSPDGRGLFVISDDGSVVTYLRLGEKQMLFILHHRGEMIIDLPEVRGRRNPSAMSLEELRTEMRELRAEEERIQGLLKRPHPLAESYLQEALVVVRWRARSVRLALVPKENKEITKEEETRMSENHPDLGFPVSRVLISGALSQEAGNMNEARRLLQRGSKINSTFDPSTWEETAIIEDSETGIRVRVILQQSSSGRVVSADVITS